MSLVTCPECGGDDLEVAEKLQGDARVLRCEDCGHTWQRGVEPPKPREEVGGRIRRPQRGPSPQEIEVHKNRDNYREAMRYWTQQDDAMSPIAPTLENPYCIQPYDPAFFEIDTRASRGECYGTKHPKEMSDDPTWMCKPLKPNWQPMCEYHMSKWTGWSNRLRPEEVQIITFQDDDFGFEEWIASRSGYVLVEREGSEFMIHDSDCIHLGRESDQIRLTEKARRWAPSQGPLEAWVQLKTGAKPSHRRSCM